jgi:hypothetical protein
VNVITNLRLSNQLTQWHAASIVYFVGDENLDSRIYLVVLSNNLCLEHRVITASFTLLYK